jgi:hypothetical protein
MFSPVADEFKRKEEGPQATHVYEPKRKKGLAALS